MKLRKVMAASLAACMVASATAVSSFAASVFNGTDSAGQICLISDNGSPQLLDNNDQLTKIVGFKVTLNTSGYRDLESLITANDWYAGAFGINNSAKNWTQLGTWGINSSDIILTQGEKRSIFTLEYTASAPLFDANDKYAYFWFQDYASSVTFELTDIVLLDANGVDVRESGAAEQTPADPEPTEEATPAEPTEETPEDTEEYGDETEEWYDDETVEYGDEADYLDFFDGGVINVYGAADEEKGTPESGVVVEFGYDITDVYGLIIKGEFNADEVADEEFWIGGGIGANSASTGWLSYEWGREKPISVDFENGTIKCLADEPIFDESDTWAQLWVQIWGGTADFVDYAILGEDGEVIIGNEDLVYDPAEPQPADGNDTTTTPSDNKGNPDTGAAGVAAAAGIVALAGAAVVISRKRK